MANIQSSGKPAGSPYSNVNLSLVKLRSWYPHAHVGLWHPLEVFHSLKNLAKL